MGRIILTLAGATDFDEQDRIAGTLDVPLSVKGRAELSSLAQELRGSGIEAVYCSAEEAARESAEFLGEQLDARVRVLEDLHNLDFGLWQGLKIDDVKRKHRKVFKQWQESPYVVCPPMGETLDQVRQRVARCLKPVLKRCHSNVTLLVVPDPLRLVIRSYLKESPVERLWDNGRTQLWESIDVS